MPRILDHRTARRWSWRCCVVQLLIPFAVASAQWPWAPPRPTSDSSLRARVDSQLHFVAATAVVETAPMTLQTVISVTNRGRARLVLSGVAACPIHLRTYRDERVHGDPVWDSSRLACILLPGAWALQPGESHRFTRTTRAADILGDSLAPGRYRLAAFMAFHVERQSRWIELPTGSVRLSY